MTMPWLRIAPFQTQRNCKRTSTRSKSGPIGIILIEKNDVKPSKKLCKLFKETRDGPYF